MKLEMTGNEMKHCFECCYISSTTTRQNRNFPLHTDEQHISKRGSEVILSVLKPLLE